MMMHIKGGFDKVMMLPFYCAILPRIMRAVMENAFKFEVTM